MEKTNIMAELVITGNFLNPDYISRSLDIKPTNSWAVGSLFTGKTKVHEFSLWDVETNYDESMDVNNQLVQIYQLFKDKINIIKELKEQLQIKISIGIVVKIENDCTPSMHLERWLIEFANNIGAEIDIDLYVNS
jgi:hypothetical protein